MDFSKKVANWQRDPFEFVTHVLVNPETGKSFELYPAQERFLREALTPTADGRLKFSEILFSAPKKAGKTATAAMPALYIVICLGGPYAEAYCVANDFDQAQGRVFQAISRIVEASPMLHGAAKLTADKITFTSTGATISAFASDYVVRLAQIPRSRFSMSYGRTLPSGRGGSGMKWYPSQPGK